MSESRLPVPDQDNAHLLCAGSVFLRWAWDRDDRRWLYAVHCLAPMFGVTEGG